MDEWHTLSSSQQPRLSYPSVPLANVNDSSDTTSNPGLAGWLFGTVSTEPTSEFTPHSEPPSDVGSSGDLRPDAQPLVVHDADALVREGFMCPECMTDFPSAEMLQRHFASCSLANAHNLSGSGTEDRASANSNEGGLTAASLPTFPPDPTKAWANAVPSYQYQTAEQPRSSPAPKSSAANSGTKGHMVSHDAALPREPRRFFKCPCPTRCRTCR